MTVAFDVKIDQRQRRIRSVTVFATRSDRVKPDRIMLTAQDIDTLLLCLDGYVEWVNGRCRLTTTEDGFERRSRLIAESMDIQERRKGRVR